MTITKTTTTSSTTTTTTTMSSNNNTKKKKNIVLQVMTNRRHGQLVITLFILLFIMGYNFQSFTNIYMKHFAASCNIVVVNNNNDNNNNNIETAMTTTTTTAMTSGTVVDDGDTVDGDSITTSTKAAAAHHTTTSTTTTGGKFIVDVPYSKLLLRQPFYIYEDEIYHWETNATTIIKSKNTTTMTTLPEIMFTDFKGFGGNGTINPKHTDDWYFLMWAFQHPMRTLNPKKAKLFIVPTLINEWMRTKNWYNGNDGFCVTFKNKNYTYDKDIITTTNTTSSSTTKSITTNKLCGYELLRQVDNTLYKSEWFQRNQGKDHIVVVSHSSPRERLSAFWNNDGGRYHKTTSGKRNAKQWNFKALKYCNIFGYSNSPIGRINVADGTRLYIPKFYVSSPCEPVLVPTNYDDHTNNKVIDFAMIGTLHPTKKTFY